MSNPFSFSNPNQNYNHNPNASSNTNMQVTQQHAKTVTSTHVSNGVSTSSASTNNNNNNVAMTKTTGPPGKAKSSSGFASSTLSRNSPVNGRRPTSVVGGVPGKAGGDGTAASAESGGVPSSSRFRDIVARIEREQKLQGLREVEAQIRAAQVEKFKHRYKPAQHQGQGREKSPLSSPRGGGGGSGIFERYGLSSGPSSGSAVSSVGHR